MPELADVERFRRIAEAAVGQRIDDVDIIDPDVVRHTPAPSFRVALEQQCVAAARRLGKWLIVDTTGPSILVHFAMTGSLRWSASDTPPERFDRVRFIMTRGILCYADRRRLGGIQLAAGASPANRELDELGPDALSVGLQDLRDRARLRRTSIKSALMDQTVLAGLGNMLTDEILWRAKIHPATSTQALTGAHWLALHRTLRRTLHTAVRAGHTPRGPRWLTGVRGDDMAACPSCGTTLERTRIGGRSSIWCPSCQPEREPAAPAKRD